MEEIMEEVKKNKQEDEIEYEDCLNYKITEKTIERERKAVKITSKALKFGLIFIAVFGLITLALNISCFCLSVKEDYALTHYRNYENTALYLTTYGCGEDDCKYCNGQTSSSIDNFVYYQTLSTIHATINNPKIVCNVVFWLLFALYMLILIFNLIMRIQVYKDIKEFKSSNE